jgi:hypothetical protein
VSLAEGHPKEGSAGDYDEALGNGNRGAHRRLDGASVVPSILHHQVPALRSRAVVLRNRAPNVCPRPVRLLPKECQEGDLAFRVQRRTSSGSWRGVYSDSTLVFTDSLSSTAGTDTTRLYYPLFRGSRYYCGSLRRYRLFVTFVDQFLDTPNPRNVHYFRSCR